MPLALVVCSLDHPDARTLAEQLDGELASIYGGLTTGRDVMTGRTQPTDRKRSVRSYEGVVTATAGVLEPYLGAAADS